MEHGKPERLSVWQDLLRQDHRPVTVLVSLKEAIKQKARQLGFTLAGVTSCAPLTGYDIFETWLNAGMHGSMEYLAAERSRLRRANPAEILPECRTILVLGMPYAPASQELIASYALGQDYHEVIPQRLAQLVDFIETEVGHPVPNRFYTDTGPLLERELAQRAGLGWIGKNTCLIHPQAGSTFFLAEILLGIELEPDDPFQTDHCGTCTRCLEACPTQCILPDRILDARRCISYLTIELKDDIPNDLRPFVKDWVFGCDICQQVCPWNRFSGPADAAFEQAIQLPVLDSEILLTPREFNQRYGHTPIQRAKRRGYVRNVTVAIGNRGNPADIPSLERALDDPEQIVRDHARWAIARIQEVHNET
jgi:epoxyqueuosine reductase